mmetsp:Transcript_58787/g.124667  ORF Transcript_58787/g.124667 Transcript_58787/m.124667 type:complete len:574 (-) Transcript_58787:544-2265(-)
MLADEAHADGDDFRTGHGELPELEGLELGASQINGTVQHLGNDLLCLRAVDEDDSPIASDVLDVHLLVRFQVLLHPAEVVQLVARVASNVEVVVGKPNERKLGPDLPGRGNKVAETHSTNGRQLVRDEPAQELGRALPCDAVVRKGPVAQASVVQDLVALTFYCCFPVGWPGKGGHLVLQILRLGVEPIWSLPAVGKSQLGAPGLEFLNDVALGSIFTDDGPSARAVLVEVSGLVVPTISLFDLVRDPIGRRPGSITSGVGLDEFVGWFALEHPMHQVSAQSSTMGDAVRLGAGVPVVRLLVRGSHEVIAVGGPAGGSVQDRLDANSFEERDEVRCCFHTLLETIHVTLEEVVSKFWGHRSLPLFRGQFHDVLALVRPDEHAVALISEVVRALQVANDGKLVAVLGMVSLHFGDSLGDDILMLDHSARSVNAREVSDALGPETGAIDHLFGLHRVSLSVRELEKNLPRPVRLGSQAHNFRVFVDLTTQCLRFTGIRLGDRGWIDMSISLRPKGRDDTLGVDERMVPLSLFGTDKVHLGSVEEALVKLGLGERVVSLLQAILVLDEAHRAGLVE